MCCSTVPYFGTTVSFLHYCSVFSQQNKNGTVYFVPLFRVFVPLFRFCTTVPFFARLFRTIEQKRNSVFCTTVPCFCTYVPFFNHCSVFPHRNKNGTVCLRITVPFFCLHFCSVFPQQNKNGSVYFVPLFRVFVPLFRFCTTVPFLHNCSIYCNTAPFFHNETKTEQCILNHCSVFLYHCFVFQLLFRFSSTEQKRNSVFSYHCSVFALLFRFPITEQKRNSVFCTTVPCFHTTVPVFHNGTKTEQCILYHCSVFLYYCSVFAPLFRFCTTVPFFFALLFCFSTKEQNI